MSTEAALTFEAMAATGWVVVFICRDEHAVTTANFTPPPDCELLCLSGGLVQVFRTREQAYKWYEEAFKSEEPYASGRYEVRPTNRSHDELNQMRNADLRTMPLLV